MAKIFLLLISSSESTEYKLMKKIHQYYLQQLQLKLPFDFLFIENQETLASEFLLESETKTLSIKGKESLVPGILQKTIKSFEYFLGDEKRY